jgi:hypothetical protein
MVAKLRVICMIGQDNHWAESKRFDGRQNTDLRRAYRAEIAELRGDFA